MDIEWTKCTSLGRPTFGTCSLDPFWAPAIIRLLKGMIMRNKQKFHTPICPNILPRRVFHCSTRQSNEKGSELPLCVLSIFGITQTIKQMFGIICIPGNLHSLELALNIDTVVLALCDSTASCPKKTNL